VLAKQVRSYYENKENYPCPLTEKLIKAGYQQAEGGYIDFAKEQGLEIDYRKGSPTQWWHLIRSYCDKTKPDEPFKESYTCGELIFWMAEVANCVDTSKMEKLVNDIIESGTPTNPRNPTKPNAIYHKNKWNPKIHELCYESINKAVEESYRTSNL